jgi:ATP-dependent Lon protease
MIEFEREGEVIRVGKIVPLLPLRDLVVFPSMVVPLLVGRKKSVKATEEAMKGDKTIFLLTQRDPEVADPKRSHSSKGFQFPRRNRIPGS